PFAEQAWGPLDHGLDDYATEWVHTATASCEATRVRGDQAEEVLELRTECLDQRREDLAALVGILGDPPKALVEKGGKAATELPTITTCSNVALLRAPNAVPVELVPIVKELNKQTSDARAQIIAGNYLAGGARAAAISRR